MKKPSKKLLAILTCAVIVCALIVVVIVTLIVPHFSKPADTTADPFVDVIPTEKYTSITDVAVAGDYVYAADKTGKHVYKLSKDGTVEATYAASAQVNGVCVNGDNVYVLEGVADGKVVVLDSSMQSTATISVGHTPTAMTIKDNKGYVANRFDNNVSVLDLSTNQVTSTVDIDGREVVDMALAGDKLYVACHLPDEGSGSDVISANVVVINTATDEVSGAVELVNGAGGVKGIAAAPDGETVYVSHIVARYTYPTTQLDRGWINTNCFSRIDTATDTAIAMMLDEVEEGAANPWGVGVNEDGTKLIVALSGTDEAMIIDIDKMNKNIDAVQRGRGSVSSVDRIVDYLPFLDNCRTRVSLSGKGARALTVDGNTAYIGQYFTGDIATVDMSSNATDTISFVEQPENDDVRSGEILFADATLCYQKWQSCLSCHPDALADGFNWDNLNDGLGNPKSAKSLLYSHRTPPEMSTGIRASAEIAVRAGMKYIQFNALPEEQMAQIDEYLKTLQPVQSPYLNTDGTLTESAENGKELFSELGCATCHPAPLYTDLKLHHSTLTDTAGNWETRDMDTPTLVEVWRTGPWGYDGRFATMEDAIRFYTKDKNLTDQQITDLTNYVMSIGNENEDWGVEQVFVNSDSGTAISALTAGGEVVSFTVRRQQEDAAHTVTVTAVLKDAQGKTIKSTDTKLTGVFFNAVEEITLSGFDIPEGAGSTLTITIKNSKGEEIASPYVLNN